MEESRGKVKPPSYGSKRPMGGENKDEAPKARKSQPEKGKEQGSQHKGTTLGSERHTTDKEHDKMLRKLMP